MSENETIVLECHNFEEGIFYLTSFWIEGIISFIVATFGIFGNTGASYILAQKEMRNSFNLLLIALSCFDNFYLFCGLLESLRIFKLETKVHTILFPYFLYPFQMIAMTGSILLTVAIALERYVAVHYPLNYNQNMNDSVALKQRMIKYLVPVSVMSFVFNITKFFEAKLVYAPADLSVENNGSSSSNFSDLNSNNVTEQYDYTPYIIPTSLRLDPIYSIYFNWFRFLSIGVVPFGLLVLFNAKIYKDLSARRKRAICADRKQNMELGYKKKSEYKKPKIIIKIDEPIDASNCTSIFIESNSTMKDRENSNEEEIQSVNLSEGSPKDQNNSACSRIKPTNVQSKPLPKLTAKLRPSTDHRANVRRRRMEDHLASIFMVYILVFLICHSPRLVLNIYELVIIRRAIECTRAGLPPFPLWCLIVTSFSHLLLTLNSSINLLIYCVLSSKFRDQCVKVTSRIYRKMRGN